MSDYLNIKIASIYVLKVIGQDRRKIYGFDDLTLPQTSVTQCRYDWWGKSFLREGNAPPLQTERLDFDDVGIRS